MHFTVPMEKMNWVKFNVNQTGYYLINYDKEEWGRLIEVLNTNHEVSNLHAYKCLFIFCTLIDIKEFIFSVSYNFEILMRI